MNYEKVLSGILYEVENIGDVTEIKNLRLNSTQVLPADTFIAVVGRKTDGHNYIQSAINNGAKVIICNKNMVSHFNIPKEVTVISVENTRDILSLIVNNFYNHPSKKFKLIGVTGTNGKTSVTTMANYILRKLGYNTCLIGTIDIYINDEIIDIERTNPTTPDCLELGKIMNLCVENDVEFVLMEVSSMALKMKRVQSCDFDTAVFTNISPEHLDDHKTMQDYKESKLKLFSLAKNAVINMDDEVSREVNENVFEKCICYGIENKEKCNLYASDISFRSEFVEFTVWWENKPTRIKVMIPSLFAVYNSLAVIGICISFGLKIDVIKKFIEEKIYIAGRYEILKGKSKTVIVDFAHTPAALENLLMSIRKNESYKKIISVFGCGGDRDPSKRAVMGTISQKYADYSIITSDNPRTESPIKIIGDILEGVNVDRKNFCIEEDREKAIKKAIEMATEDDVVVISGKGHEQQQIFGNKVVEFSDKKVAERYL